MQYPSIVTGTFRSRPNRFIALVDIDGVEQVCHVKNTGRCRELLLPGSKVILAQASNPARKTKYDLIAVYKGDLLINMDSQAPNAAVGEWLQNGGLFALPQNQDGQLGSYLRTLRPETKYCNSRFDFYLESDTCRMFLEVKGVTLEEDGVLLFPDAPTERGVKHLRELIAVTREGYRAGVLFVLQMEQARLFMPNRQMHPEFAQALKEAADAGVLVLAMNCHVTPDSMTLWHPVPVQL